MLDGVLSSKVRINKLFKISINIKLSISKKYECDTQYGNPFVGTSSSDVMKWKIFAELKVPNNFKLGDSRLLNCVCRCFSINCQTMSRNIFSLTSWKGERRNRAIGRTLFLLGWLSCNVEHNKGVRTIFSWKFEFSSINLFTAFPINNHQSIDYGSLFLTASESDNRVNFDENGRKENSMYL